MGINAGGAVFGIRKVEYGAPFRGMFLGIAPMGYTCRFGKGGARKGPAVWPRVTSFSKFLSMTNGLLLAQGRLEYSLGALGPE